MKSILTFLIVLLVAMFDAAISVMLRFVPCAFDPTNMNRVQIGTCTLWIYKTVDTVATVIADGYFNDISDQMNQGDIILISDTNASTCDMGFVDSADKAAIVKVTNAT